MVDATKIFPVDIRIIKTLRSDRWELTSRVEETWANGIFEWVSCISLKPVEKFSSRTIEVGGNHVLEPASKLVRYSNHWRLLRSDKVLWKDFYSARWALYHLTSQNKTHTFFGTVPLEFKMLMSEVCLLKAHILLTEISSLKNVFEA